MSVFARRSGVPVPTIKHYLREGLLPEPVRRSRNMAYYDAGLVPRVRAIKKLQRELQLPLKVIARVLDRVEHGELPADAAVEATIARVLGELAPAESTTRGQLLEQGSTEDELELLQRLGLLAPEHDVYRGDDVALMRVLAQGRRAGFTAEMLPTEIMIEYVEALSNLARVELQLFRRGVVPSAGDKLPKLTEAAAVLSERLVVLLRRKLLLPALTDLVAGGATLNSSQG